MQATHGVHRPFEIPGGGRLLRHLVEQAGVDAEFGVEPGVEHGVQRRRIAAEGPRQSRGEGHDADDPLEQLWLVQEQGLDLNPRRQSGEEDREPLEGGIGRAGPGQGCEQPRRQSGEQLAPPHRTRRRDAAVVPGADGVGDRTRIGKAHPFQGRQGLRVVVDAGEDETAKR